MSKDKVRREACKPKKSKTPKAPVTTMVTGVVHPERPADK